MPQLIGTEPGQVPTNADLGGMAYQAPEGVVIRPQPVATPNAAGDMVFQLANDTSLQIRVRGSDGVVRSVTLTLA